MDQKGQPISIRDSLTGRTRRGSPRRPTTLAGRRCRTWSWGGAAPGRRRGSPRPSRRRTALPATARGPRTEMGGRYSWFGAVTSALMTIDHMTLMAWHGLFILFALVMMEVCEEDEDYTSTEELKVSISCKKPYITIYEYIRKEGVITVYLQKGGQKSNSYSIGSPNHSTLITGINRRGRQGTFIRARAVSYFTPSSSRN